MNTVTRRVLLVCAVLSLLGASGCECGDPSTGTRDGGDDGGQTDDDAGRTDAGMGECGDGVRQRSEVCDDGNNTDGDGCSADCTSNERCGNGSLDTAVGELCDDGNNTDGDTCRGDCLSDYRCGNGVVDRAADGAPVDEVCDDGNTAGGDGCSNACDSDESCGNGVVDTLVGEVCDDGNTEDGDDCSADCSMSLLCGNGELDGAEECDDGNTMDGDGCSASCRMERCGNGRIDGAEECDDGNTADDDGCDSDCTFTCSTDADCADADVCNGAETCTDPGTDASACVAGSPAADGTTCPIGICTGGVCAAAGCGDGIVTAPEECDDGNTTSGDGCDADCMWTCSAAADCSDGDACSGTETCAMPGTLMSRCMAGTPLADGSVCDADMMAGTRDICRSGACAASRCGDGFVDAGATPPEQCDDGNTAAGDGCSATCQTEVVTPTGFRITNLDLVSPRIVASVLFCIDGTGQVNSLIDDEIGTNYSLHIVDVFRPLNPAAAVTAAEVHFNAACDATPTPDACSPDATPDMIMSNANNLSAGTCFTPDPALVGSYTGLSSATAPCFVSDEVTLTVAISGISIPLQRARVAATYSGTPVNRLINGTVTGFLTETAAADLVLPEDIALVGGDRLYEHLRGGNRRVRDSAGTLINDGCGGGDDADLLDPTMPMSATNPRGFWFFLAFQADRITWTEP